MSKYGNKKTIVHGITFDSKMEAEYYQYLKMLENVTIFDIHLQPKFMILPSYTDTEGKKQRPIYYQADFLVKYESGLVEVIDVKGVETEAFKLKKKMFESRYGMKLKVVTKCNGKWIELKDKPKSKKNKKIKIPKW